jgi:hypothetical protein
MNRIYSIKTDAKHKIRKMWISFHNNLCLAIFMGFQLMSRYEMKRLIILNPSQSNVIDNEEMFKDKRNQDTKGKAFKCSEADV